MSESSKTESTVERSSRKKTFHGTYCDFIEFGVSVATDKFKLKEFSKPFSKQTSDGVAFTALFSPKRENYHAHLQWYQVSEQIKVTLSFHAGSMKPQPGETEPWAEGVMQWLGQFFTADTGTVAETYVGFAYPEKQWRTVFPLSMKFALSDGGEVETSGIELTFPSNGAQDARQAFVTNDGENVRVLMRGRERIEFAQFILTDEISRFAALGEKLVVGGAR